MSIRRNFCTRCPVLTSDVKMFPWRSTAMLWSAVNMPTCRPGRPKRPSVSFEARSTMRTSPFMPSNHMDEFLLLVGREHEVVDRAGAARRLLVDLLGHEAAVFAED